MRGRHLGILCLGILRSHHLRSVKAEVNDGADAMVFRREVVRAELGFLSEGVESTLLSQIPAVNWFQLVSIGELFGYVLTPPLGGGEVHPNFLGKLDLEIGVYQKAPPIGGTFGEISESLRISLPAQRPLA